MDDTPPGAPQPLPERPVPEPLSTFPAFLALSGPAMNQLLWFIVFVAGALSFYYLARRKRVLVRNPPDPWVDPRSVRNILLFAGDQNATVQLQARVPDETSGSLTGICVGLDEQKLSIQIISPITTGSLKQWIGRDIEGFFCISTGQQYYFYQCASVVLRLTGDDRFPMLEIAAPLRLEPFQRRAFPRSAPARPQVLGMGLWPAPQEAPGTVPQNGSRLPSPLTEALTNSDPLAHSGKTTDRLHALRTLVSRGADSAKDKKSPLPQPVWDHARRPLPSTMAHLGSPLAICRPPVVESIRLANISASGLGLRVHKSRTAAIPPFCLIFLSLRQPGGKALNLWLACERRHITAQAGRGSAIVGLRLLQWSAVSRADMDITWNQVSNRGGVPPLVHWINRHEAAQRRAQAKYVNL